MTERESLIELIKQAEEHFSDTIKPILDIEEYVADYLLENGVIVPPVKLGDTVYHIYPKQGIKPYKIKRIQYGTYGIMLVDKSGVFPVDAIGKTVFLSYEDAEKTVEGWK